MILFLILLHIDIINSYIGAGRFTEKLKKTVKKNLQMTTLYLHSKIDQNLFVDMKELLINNNFDLQYQ